MHSMRSFLSSIIKSNEEKEPVTELQKKLHAKDQAFELLKQADKSICGVTGITSATWMFLFGSLSSGYGLILLPILVKAYEKTFIDRDGKRERHEKKLKELLAYYQKEVKDDIRATHRHEVMEVLRAIAPYIIRTRDLLPPNFYTNYKNLSEEFYEILSKQPHNLQHYLDEQEKQLDEEKKPNSPSFLNTLSENLPNRVVLNKVRDFVKQFYRQTPCERIGTGAFQYMYGYDSGERRPGVRMV